MPTARSAASRSFPALPRRWQWRSRPLTGIPGVSNFGGYFGAFLKYAGFDALKVTGKSDREVMLVINGFTSEITIEEAPHDEEAFDLEKHIAERFTAAGYEKRNIAFMSTGIGAINTAYGCINSHYFDVTKPAKDGGKGVWRTKQAGRTGIGSVMRGKGLFAIVVLAEYPHGDNPYGAADWEKVRDAGRRLHSHRQGDRSAAAEDGPQRERRPDHLHEQAANTSRCRSTISRGAPIRGPTRSAASIMPSTFSSIAAWTAAFPAATCSAPRGAG